MSSNKPKLNRDLMLQEMNILLNRLEHENPKKSELVIYWLRDYTRYLQLEERFRPDKLIKYKRGTIIKVNLGFNIHREYGGLHYGVVLNKEDAPKKPLLNIIPLTSFKSDNPNKATVKENVFLGDELYLLLKNNINEIQDKSQRIIEELEQITEQQDPSKILEQYITQPDIGKILLEMLREKIKNLRQLKEESNRKIETLSSMKEGSIALVDQITTISKMRIYVPKTKNDPFYNLRISNESMNKIDDKIKELFTHIDKN